MPILPALQLGFPDRQQKANSLFRTWPTDNQKSWKEVEMSSPLLPLQLPIISCCWLGAESSEAPACSRPYKQVSESQTTFLGSAISAYAQFHSTAIVHFSSFTKSIIIVPIITRGYILPCSLSCHHYSLTTLCVPPHFLPINYQQNGSSTFSPAAVTRCQCAAPAYGWQAGLFSPSFQRSVGTRCVRSSQRRAGWTLGGRGPVKCPPPAARSHWPPSPAAHETRALPAAVRWTERLAMERGTPPMMSQW